MRSINVIDGGLDVHGIVDKLMEVEHQPVDRMQSQTTTGSHGTVTVVPATPADEGAGTIVNLRTMVKRITDPLSNPVHNATDSLSQNIRSIQDQIKTYEDKLTIRKQPLADECSRADRALRLMIVNQTSLTSQVNSLSQFAQ